MPVFYSSLKTENYLIKVRFTKWKTAGFGDLETSKDRG